MAKLAQRKLRVAELEAEVRRLRSLVEKLQREARSPAAAGAHLPPRGKRTAQ